MWIATLQSKQENFNNIDFVVEFTDGTDTFTKTYKQEKGRVNVIEIKRAVKRQLDDLNNPPIFPEGAIDFSDLTSQQTQEETDFQLWLTNFNRLETATKLVTLGVIPANNAKLVALKDAVTAGLQASYIDRL